ncbi:hypothetical protein [Pontibacter akesuensis]|uniref:hypothetical protein n=1 Tax=Pontibacter akesuensis TaxID=388950 RepID=UPI00083ADF8B|nr:hypothetical protein [Pontibacter akesuensis]GHA61733.1 hypothetical protein GCM10007389_12840 [Pontibacter akesuensis]
MSLAVFCVLFFLSTDKTLEISSATGSIEQKLDLSDKAEKSLMDLLRRHSAIQKAYLLLPLQFAFG